MFDYQDFSQNPGKYQLFRTAELATNIFTENGEDDLQQGEGVNISFLRIAPNRLFKRDEPVYTVTKNGAFWGHLYASALTHFIL